MRESEERLRGIYEAAHDAIFVVDPLTECILDANSQASDLLGYTQDELRGMQVSEMHPEEMDQLRKKVHETLETGMPTRTDELSCITRDDRCIPVEMAFSRLDLRDRHLVLTMVHDITERKCAEKELERSLSLLRTTLDSTADGIVSGLIDTP